jgi:hypothetical protein
LCFSQKHTLPFATPISFVWKIGENLQAIGLHVYKKNRVAACDSPSKIMGQSFRESFFRFSPNSSYLGVVRTVSPRLHPPTYWNIAAQKTNVFERHPLYGVR